MKKSRVSWPSDSMLCQVKMFVKEECPAKVASQSSIKTKPSNLQPEHVAKRSISHIPRIKWKLPPKFILNEAWLVGSGEESRETSSENLRVAKVLEAFYPHCSVPLVSSDVVDESFDDITTPNIRLTPIEDEHEDSSTGLVPDLTLVDAHLLVQLLSDPIIIKSLMNHKTPKPFEALNTKPTPIDRIPSPVSTALPLNLQRPLLISHTFPLPRPVDDVAVSEPLNIKVPESDPQILNGAYPMNTNRDDQVSAKPVKNLDYFKNLIREHGVVQTRNETNDDNVKVVKVKIQKQCMYFGRARGCKLGESCLYLHDHSKRLRSDVAAHFPKAKRLQFGS